MLSADEKEKRLRVIENGVKSEFWKVLVEHVHAINTVDMQSIVDFHHEGKEKEAHNLALEVKARQDIIKEPTSIIRNVKPIFDEWNEATRTWMRKSADKIKKVFSK